MRSLEIEEWHNITIAMTEKELPAGEKYENLGKALASRILA
jgi:hypothetical protein